MPAYGSAPMTAGTPPSPRVNSRIGAARRLLTNHKNILPMRKQGRSHMQTAKRSQRRQAKLWSEELHGVGSTGSQSVSTLRREPELPLSDNTPEGLAMLQAANHFYRRAPWPSPFDLTKHHLHQGDARELSWIRDNSVHLVVTSPPYWTLKKYGSREGQMGDIKDYDKFLDELDKVWRHCERILVEGGRICCIVGDVCIPRKRDGRHRIMPLHADIQVRARSLGMDCLTPIMWHKIANGVTEAQGNGAGFYGKPYQPGAVVKNDIEYILFMRKRGEYRKTTSLQKRFLCSLKRKCSAGSDHSGRTSGEHRRGQGIPLLTR